MKKKLFVLLVILAVVLTGVFAAPADIADDATVTLKGSIISDFQHGARVDGVMQSQITITDALKLGGVLFDYAYKSNEDISGAKIYMKYTDFYHTNDSDFIQIKSVLVDSSVPSYDSTDGFEVFDEIKAGVSAKVASIKIVAAQTTDGNDAKGATVTNSVADAPAGDYTATLTFSVKTI